jgi:hypothetical protein
MSREEAWVWGYDATRWRPAEKIDGRRIVANRKSLSGRQQMFWVRKYLGTAESWQWVSGMSDGDRSNDLHLTEGQAQVPQEKITKIEEQAPYSPQADAGLRQSKLGDEWWPGVYVQLEQALHIPPPTSHRRGHNIREKNQSNRILPQPSTPLHEWIPSKGIARFL